MSEIVPYNDFVPPSSSSRRIKITAPLINPNMLTESAQLKYDAMKFNFMPGVAITFHSHPDIFIHLKKVGWDCLVYFSNTYVYPEFVSELYAHIEFFKYAFGTLQSLSTYVRGRKLS